MPQLTGQVKSDEPLNDIFSGYDATGGTAITGATTITITNEHLVSSATFSLANNEVTVQAGDYEVTFGASMIVSTGNARTQGQAWLERNGVEVAGTRTALYCRQANHGATGSAQIFLTCAQDDVLRIRGQRTAGSGALTTLANGSRLALRKL